MNKPIPFDKAKMTTGAVLIEFYASWCPHCRKMMPIVKEVRELLGSMAPVYQYDIDEYPDAADEAGVSSIPTFIVFDNSREMWRFTGELSGDELLAQVQAAMDSYVN